MLSLELEDDTALLLPEEERPSWRCEEKKSSEDEVCQPQRCLWWRCAWEAPPRPPPFDEEPLSPKEPEAE